MEAVALSKAIYDKAKSLGIKAITLEFSGGNDEGCLEVTLDDNGKVERTTKQKETLNKFGDEVENWAWNVYSYSGAGDGNNYGDNITYDLENNKVITNEWHMERTDTPEEENVLEITEADGTEEE